jgi:RNA polymerase sigma factor (sigma-70 family)
MENVEDHIGLASYIARLYLPENSIVEDSEEYAEALIGIWQAAQTFDPDQGVEFATYAQTKARWRIQNLQELAHNRFYKSAQQLDLTTSSGDKIGPQSDLLSDGTKCAEEILEVEEQRRTYCEWLQTRREMVEELLPKLTEPQRSAIRGVLQGKVYREIAEELGVSRQAVQRAFAYGIRDIIEWVGGDA